MIDQQDVLNWAVTNFGEVAKNADERAARLVEEAIEIAQQAGVPPHVIDRITKRVYSRPVGSLVQEVGGTGIALLAFCANSNIDFENAIMLEWNRVSSLPPEWWQQKHAEKVAAGTANLSPARIAHMRTEMAEQWNIPCVVIVVGVTAQDVINKCVEDEACKFEDDDELVYCVQFPGRPQELYSESAIRRSFPLPFEIVR